MTEPAEGQEVLFCREDAVAVVTFNRPHASNAMNNALRHRFISLMHEIRRDDRVRVVVLTGAGDRAFSAGGDLKERDGLSTAELLAQREFSCSRALFRYPKPLVAAINGDAVGGGFEVAMFCDIRVAAEHARFGLPEVRRGILPGGGGTSLLPRLIGLARAKELILTGRLITAREACEAGFLHAVVSGDQVLAKALAYARLLAANAPLALRQAKMVMEESLGLPADSALLLENEAWNRCLFSEDRKEGIRAFVEKRAPQFTGR